jgi:hypothetical protein
MLFVVLLGVRSNAGEVVFGVSAVSRSIVTSRPLFGPRAEREVDGPSRAAGRLASLELPPWAGTMRFMELNREPRLIGPLVAMALVIVAAANAYALGLRPQDWPPAALLALLGDGVFMVSLITWRIMRRK